MVYPFLTGSYASPGEEGICLFRLDTEQGSLEKVWAQDGIENPSWILYDRERMVLYAVSETTPEGAVCSFRLKEDGLALLSRVKSGGADPCHLSLAAEGRYLLAANYTGGSLGVFAPDEAGVLKGRAALVEPHGSGPNRVRQEKAHVHFSQERDGLIYVTDLGMDRVFCYRPEPAEGTLSQAEKPLALPPGSGPRHLAFRGEHLYVLCELSGEVSVFRRSGEGFGLIQRLSMLPEGFSGSNIASAVRISGEFLLTGNRGHDSVALSRILEDGTLTLLEIVPCGGRTPRDLAVMGDWVAVANQDSDQISFLSLDRKKGRLSDTGIRVRLPKPSCICPV